MDYKEMYQDLKKLYDKAVADRDALALEVKALRESTKAMEENCQGYIKELQKTLYEAMLQKEAYKRLNDELGLVLSEIKSQGLG